MAAPAWSFHGIQASLAGQLHREVKQSRHLSVASSSVGDGDTS